jgi:hypothetical protein
MAYLPDLPQNGKLYVERDFLFAIVNTVDKTISEKPWQRLSKEGQLGTVNQEVG